MLRIQSSRYEQGLLLPVCSRLAFVTSNPSIPAAPIFNGVVLFLSRHTPSIALIVHYENLPALVRFCAFFFLVARSEGLREFIPRKAFHLVRQTYKYKYIHFSFTVL